MTYFKQRSTHWEADSGGSCGFGSEQGGERRDGRQEGQLEGWIQEVVVWPQKVEGDKLEECLEALTEGKKGQRPWLSSAWGWAVRISQAQRQSEEHESSR